MIFTPRHDFYADYLAGGLALAFPVLVWALITEQPGSWLWPAWAVGGSIVSVWAFAIRFSADRLPRTAPTPLTESVDGSPATVLPRWPHHAWGTLGIWVVSGGGLLLLGIIVGTWKPPATAWVLGVSGFVLLVLAAAGMAGLVRPGAVTLTAAGVGDRNRWSRCFVAWDDITEVDVDGAALLLRTSARTHRIATAGIAIRPSALMMAVKGCWRLPDLRAELGTSASLLRLVEG